MNTNDGERSLKFRLLKASVLGLDFVMPPECMGCDTLGEHWCERCEASVAALSSRCCQICASESSDEAYCQRCMDRRPHFDAAYALGKYSGPLAQALVGLKYRKNDAIGYLFAPLLAEIVAKKGWHVDAIVALPLAKERYLERGYNQVEIFSSALAMYMGVLHAPTYLARIKETPSQVGLSIEERQENMRQAFHSEAGLVAKKSILLMDDVMTTGASLNSAAKQLKQAGAKSVFGLTVARASGKTADDVLVDNLSILEVQ